MNILWSTDRLTSAMNGRLLGTAPAGVGGVSIDTRTLQPGDLFFAIQGEARDGHEFVQGAFEKGAAIAVVDEAHAKALAPLGALLVVPDVLAAMVKLGEASRARSRARIVAVTGSVGKTGTKEALKHVLSRQGRTHASVASYNNHWGVPLTLARMPEDAEFGVFEIGMNHPFEILPLVAMVQPHVALVTTVEPVHLLYFKSVSAIADAKGEIFSGVLPGGTALINRDNPHFERLRAHAQASRAGRIVTFGEHEEADIRLLKSTLHAEFSIAEARVLGKPLLYRIGAPGRHTVMNSLAVLGAVEALGGDIALAGLALADLAPPDGRGARIQLHIANGAFTLIDESYNANPASMRAALAVLGKTPVGQNGRRIAVLGDMLELGPQGAELHAGLAEAVVANGIDLVFACGPLMRHLFEGLPSERRGGYADSSTGLHEPLAKVLHAGDAVMVKGSLGSRMGPIVSGLKSRFKDLSAEAVGS